MTFIWNFIDHSERIIEIVALGKSVMFVDAFYPLRCFPASTIVNRMFIISQFISQASLVDQT